MSTDKYFKSAVKEGACVNNKKHLIIVDEITKMITFTDFDWRLSPFRVSA